MSKWKWPGAAAVILVLLCSGWYFFSPDWTLRQMKAASDANDADAFAAFVDFQALREDAKAELTLQIAEEAKHHKAAGYPLADAELDFKTGALGRVVDQMYSPAALRAAFLARERRADVSDMGANLFSQDFPGNLTIRRRSMSEFSAFQSEQAEKALVFERHGFGWRLSGVDPLPTIFDSERSSSGTCFARYNGKVLINGRCSGTGQGASVFVSSQKDSCSIDIARSGNASILAYRGPCGDTDMDSSNHSLGRLKRVGECLVGGDAKVCLKPGAMVRMDDTQTERMVPTQ